MKVGHLPEQNVAVTGVQWVSYRMKVGHLPKYLGHLPESYRKSVVAQPPTPQSGSLTGTQGSQSGSLTGISTGTACNYCIKTLMFKVLPQEVSARRLGKVRQANALIRSKQPLDLMQKRLFYLILETIRTTDTQFSIVEFPVPLLKEILSGTYGTFYDDLKEAADGLVMTSFSLHRPSGSWATTPIFDRIEYLKTGDTNDQGYTNDNNYDVVRARLHDSLEPYLLRLEKNYNTQELVYVLSIPRVRAHRLYEILLHESFRGAKPEFEIDLADLEAFIGIEEPYKRFQDFKRMLNRQQEIIKEYTDMRFKFEGIRIGKSIGRVRFQVQFVQSTQRPIGAAPDPHVAIEEIQLAHELREAGFQRDPYETIREYGSTRIRTAIKRAKAAQAAARGTSSEIRNLGGFIHYLLQLNQEEVTIDAEASPADTFTPDQIRAFAAQFLEEFDKARADAIETVLSDLTDNERENLTNHVLTLLTRGELSVVENNKRAFTAIRNRYLIEQNLIRLPSEYSDVRTYYAGKSFGYDDKTNELIRNYL